MKARILVSVLVLAVLGALAWGAMRLVRVATATTSVEVPTTRVRRGKVSINVTARGELQGGNSEMIVVPPLGADSTAITFLRSPGELVNQGDTVVEFDTTLQEYNLREAEADLAEADQQVIQAQAAADAGDEENSYALLQAESDVKTAELNVRSNAVLPAIQARENEIALEAARKRLAQAKQNLTNKNDNLKAAIKIQQANQNKAKVTAEMNRKIIENMVVKAKSSGYVNLQNNTRNQFIWYEGMTFPTIQLGDTVYSGMPIAQILNLKDWEVSAHIGELDRGHLSEGQKVSVTLVALPGKTFSGHVKSLGGTTGSPWDRHFDCRIALDEGAPGMHPGLTSNMVITTQVLDNATWLPSEALFENGGKSFVYQRTPQGFTPRDVTLVTRGESQVVISGLKEGEVVAMSNPEQQNKPAAADKNGAMKALQK
ncbi:MAG TPA: HlyD family efflux transporter periplasmic adaptor subunit [Bryobacteraceae bacterium]|nr:HlyD family efflux transporter periplasmic adaptor subunit [Bryobacteraceae bacterium]